MLQFMPLQFSWQIGCTTSGWHQASAPHPVKRSLVWFLRENSLKGFVVAEFLLRGNFSTVIATSAHKTAKTSGRRRCTSNFRLSPANGLLAAQYQGASSC